jgi:hypothetical protein
VPHEFGDIPQRDPRAQGFGPEPVPGEVKHQVARQSGCIAQPAMRAGEIADRPRIALGAREDGSRLAMVDGLLQRLAEAGPCRSTGILASHL